MSELNKLYDPVIRYHQANPHQFKKISDCTNTVKAHNPICGDRFDFFPTIDEKKIVSMYYHGYGCAVSKAAGSVLTKTLEGKTIHEAITLCTGYIDFISGTRTINNLPEEFKPFSAVIEFPARYDCAAMAWHEMKKFLMAIKE